MDLHVTQVVDGTKGVHAMLSKAIFRNYPHSNTVEWFNRAAHPRAGPVASQGATGRATKIYFGERNQTGCWRNETNRPPNEAGGAKAPMLRTYCRFSRHPTA
jgi:hypothetical protein